MTKQFTIRIIQHTFIAESKISNRKNFSNAKVLIRDRQTDGDGELSATDRGVLLMIAAGIRLAIDMLGTLSTWAALGTAHLIFSFEQI